VPVIEPPSDDELVGGLLLRGLDVAYQPIVDLSSAELIGWEALLRGAHPGGDAINPELVVGSATRVGALDAVMRQVTEQALATATVASLRLGRTMTVTVNIEPAQLRLDRSFLRWLVDRTASCPARLLVEITERGGDVGWTADRDLALDRLQDAGIPIAIDDLGAGDARIRLLAGRHWPWVKLDRGYLLLGDRGHVLLKHMVAMLHELGSTALLEGIETEAHLDVARRAGVDLVQGNLIGLPLPAQDMLADLPPRTSS
jgi:EAL domain-containing protein (putative c-di-GMP-specific phosphodiesterase class I)